MGGLWTGTFNKQHYGWVGAGVFCGVEIGGVGSEMEALILDLSLVWFGSLEVS